MGAWYFKQPNGLYGRFSTVVDTVTEYNFTKEELYQNMVDHFGKNDYDVLTFEDFINSSKDSRSFYMHPFEDVLSDMTSSNETTASAVELLINMGMPENEANLYYFMDWPENAADDDPIWDTWECTLQKNNK